MLTGRHRHIRREWTGQRAHWTRLQWNLLLLSDVSRFSLRRASGRAIVYRRRRERYADVCVRQLDRFGAYRYGVGWHHLRQPQLNR